MSAQQKPNQEAQAKQQEKFLESTASDPRLQTLRKDMQKTKGVKSVTEPLVNKSGSAAVFTLVSTSPPSSRATEDLVDHLRDDVIPKDTKGNGMSADVGGTTAGYIDLADQIAKKLPLVIGVVLALSFVLLLLAFRSILVSLKAVVMNLLSIGAAFGIVTYAFGHDWSASLVGLDGTVPIVSFVPLMMFAILFGLSMDYEVFLMTHVRERWLATDDAHQAVIDGLAGTARVITSAALIMVSVFCAFLLNGDPNIKQFGLGMAAAVAVDATVVRCLLVPAIMSLLGRAGWWLPGWLDRGLPHLSIEGEEYFAEREAAAARGREGPAGRRMRTRREFIADAGRASLAGTLLAPVSLTAAQAVPAPDLPTQSGWTNDDYWAFADWAMTVADDLWSESTGFYGTPTSAPAPRCSPRTRSRPRWATRAARPATTRERSGWPSSS